MTIVDYTGPDSRPNVLVTGGAGYVGSVLVGLLLQQGVRVRVLDALLHGSVPSLLAAWGKDLEFVRGDIRDPAVRTTALSGVDAVVHLAAIVGDPACSRAPEDARTVNLDSTQALVREARAAGVDRFIFASTCSNYGRSDPNGLATEEWDLQPLSLYAETKVAAEQDMLAQNDGMIATCLRFATVYGISPRMRFDLTVNEFARDTACGRGLVVYGEQFWRPYVHVRDAARAIVIALEAPAGDVGAQVFNVGATTENYRKADIVEILRSRDAGLEVEFVHRDEDPRDYRVSFEKIRERLGYEVTLRVEDGIDEIAALVVSGLLADPFDSVYVN